MERRGGEDDVDLRGVETGVVAMGVRGGTGGVAAGEKVWRLSVVCPCKMHPVIDTVSNCVEVHVKVLSTGLSDCHKERYPDFG